MECLHEEGVEVSGPCTLVVVLLACAIQNIPQVAAMNIDLSLIRILIVENRSLFLQEGLSAEGR